MEIGLLWTAAMTELRSIKSSAETKTVKVTEVVETTVIILVSEKWLFKAVLGLAGAALAVAMIWDWQYLSYCSSLLISVKAWTCS